MVSKKYTSLWNAIRNHLMIMKTEVLEKIQEDQKKRHPERYQEQEKK